MNTQQNLAEQITKVDYELNFAKITFKPDMDIKSITKALHSIGITNIVHSHSDVSGKEVFYHGFILNYKNPEQKNIINNLISSYKTIKR